MWAAVSRAGLDAQEVWRRVVRGDGAARLAADHARAETSKVHRLPTFDVGERRLEGEQTEADLSDAIRAAAALARAKVDAPAAGAR